MDEATTPKHAASPASRAGAQHPRKAVTFADFARPRLPRFIRQARTRMINNDGRVREARDRVVRLLADSYEDPVKTLKRVEKELPTVSPADLALRFFANPAGAPGGWLGSAYPATRHLPDAEKLTAALITLKTVLGDARRRAEEAHPASAVKRK